MTRHRLAPFVAACAAYVALAVALTWPLAASPASVVPNDLGDPLLNVWILWWNAEAVPLSEQWWNAPQFYPVTGSLAFSEHLLGLAPLTTPVILVTGDPLLAYNLAFFLVFPLCALSAHVLVYTIVRRHDVAFVAGLAYAFAPYRMGQLAHLQVLSSYWMPMALAALHRYVEDPARRLRWPVLFAGAWLMQALACGYYLFYLSVLIVLWLAWFAMFRLTPREGLRLGAAWAAAAGLLAPLLYGYWSIARQYNLGRGLEEVASFSADVLGLLQAPPTLRVWSFLDVVDRPEGALFPGLTVVLLTVTALVLGWRRLPREGRWPRAAAVALAVAVLFAGITAARLALGPYRLELGSLRLLSVTSPHKPLSVAVFFLALAALMHPHLRLVWRRRSPLGFYALAALVMWLLALGPSPTFLGHAVLYKAPYAWLMELPGFDSVRAPARFWMLGVLCLSVTTALAVRRLSQRWPDASRVLVPLACAGILIEGWPTAVTMHPRPAERPNHAAASARLDLPPADVDTLSLYRAIFHGRPVFNGYSGYDAPHYPAMEALLHGFDPRILPRLARYGGVEIMVDHSGDPDGRWRAFVASHPAAEKVFEDAGYTSYRLPASDEDEAAPNAPGIAIPLHEVSAAVGTNLGALTDGDVQTRWDTGRPQQPGDWILADLGSPADVGGVSLSLGRSIEEFPRCLIAETSVDGAQWAAAWEGSGAVPAFDGALEDPVVVPLRLRFEPRRARYVRLTLTAADDHRWWVVTELRVFAASRRQVQLPR